MKRLYNKKIFLVFVILVLILVATTYFFYSNNKLPSNSIFPPVADAVSSGVVTEPAPSDLPTTLPSVNLPNGLVEYKNKYYKFNLNYPDILSVSEFAENGGGRTILFEGNKGNEKYGFQIFVTPYKYKKITNERFRMDEPSGIIDRPTEVLIDGLQATIFYSKNTFMGDTREVWFINNGFLYEVVTYKDLDDWLSKIMTTWKFTK